MPRDRRASEPWSTQSPETPQYAEPDPKWESLTDTGSMQPSAEALAWQRRADAWAQQAESDDSQAVEPANRWSEVASTGRTAFPADGVGWRTETAEWRATGGARWRQTTEWRSTTGSHGWRSTTEAWQTNGNGQQRPPVTTPTEQPALSSSAWSAPAEPESRPSWQQFTEPATGTPSWQQPAPRPAAESTSSWQQLVEPDNTIEGSATWNDGGSQPETPSWQTPRDDGRHLVREDDRTAWRRNTDPGGDSRPVGRRRAPEPGSRTSGGTGWTARSDADDWAGHTDTGSIQLYPEPEETPTWGARSEAGRRSLPTNGYDEGPTRHVDPAGGRHGAERPALPSEPYEEDATARRYAAGLADLADPAPRRGRYAEDDPRSDYGSAAAPTSSYGSAAPPSGYGTAAGASSSYGAPTPTSSYGAAAPTSSYGATAAGYGSAAAPTSGYVPNGRAVTDGPPASAPTSGYVPVSRRRSGRYAEEEQRPGGPIGDADDPRYVDGARSAGMPLRRPEQEAMPAQEAMPLRRPEQEAMPPRRGPEQDTNAGQPPRRGPGKPRKARYNDSVQDDWREQTGSWVAEPDTSSWTRDPDTGQWSRSQDDPRVQAWREEAARREEAHQSAARRELPAAPADEERRASWSQPPAAAGRAGIAPAGPVPDDASRRGMRPEESGMGAAPAAWAAMPAAPGSAMPAAPRSAMPAAPRSAMPAAPRSAMPAAPRSAMPAAPRSAMPDDTMTRRGMEEDTFGGRRRAAEGAPIPRADDTMTGRGMPRRGMDDGPAPCSAMPDDTMSRRRIAAMPDDGMRRRGMTDGPIPRSAMPDDTMSRRGMAAIPDDGIPRRGMTDGPIPRSAMPDDARPRWAMPDDDAGTPGRWGQDDEPTPRRSRRDARRDDDDDPRSAYGLRGGYSDETRGGGRRGYDDPRGGYGTAADPQGGGGSAGVYGGAPGGYDDGSRGGGYGEGGNYGLRADHEGSRGGMPDGPRPRSAMPAAPRSGMPAAPRSAMPAAPRSGMPAAPRSAMPAAPASALRASVDGMPGAQRALPSAPRSAMPSTDAPVSPIPNGGGTYGGGSYRAGSYRDEAYPDGDRRRAAGDDTTGGGWRRAADEPAGPDAWRRDLDPDARQPRSLPGYDDPDEWRANAAGRGGAGNGVDDRSWPPRGGAAAAPADWRSEERDEVSRGHAAYREGGSEGWRRELSAQSDIGDGESRRYGTSDFVPFRSSGSAAVPRQSNISMTSTSMIMPAGGPDPVAARPQRAASNGYMAPGGAYERRPVGGGFTTGRRSNLLDPDDEEDDQAAGGPLAAVGYTVIWYGVPVVLFVLYMLIVNRGSQSHALDTASKAAPQFGVSLVLSMLVAVGIRWVTSSWKAISVGLAAAVVGGGLATVLSSALTGNSLS